MRRHVTFVTVITLMGAFSSSGWGTIVINNPAQAGASNVALPPANTAIPGASPGASPVPSTGTSVTTATFYYSNITANKDASAVPNYIDGGGANCNNKINANCRNATGLFTLSATSNVATSGSPVMYWIYSTVTPTGTISALTTITSAPYTANNAVSLPLTFGQICAKISALVAGLGNNCEETVPGNGPHKATFYLIADPTGSGTVGSEVLAFTMIFISSIPSVSTNKIAGLYDFLAFPGDEKIHIRGPNGAAGPLTDGVFPTGENQSTGASYVRFYFAPNTAGATDSPASRTDLGSAGFTPIDPATAPSALVKFTDISVNSAGDLSSTTIDGLTNGVRYYVRAALVDAAGNVGYLTTDTDGPNHSTIPDQVVGLLAETGHCFVATAAFGSPLAEQVQVLRDFRDRYLMRSLWGRHFVSWYYRHSPKWAAKIAPREDLRSVARAFLYPVVGFSWLALKWGAFNAVLFLTTLLLLPLLAYKWKTLTLLTKSRS